MWQVNAVDYNYVSLRPHQWKAGAAGVIAPEVDISTAIASKEDAVGRTHHMKIEANNGEIKTYINDVLVDTRTVAGATLGKIGFRQGINEGAKFDNIVVKHESGKVLFNEDFSNGNASFGIGTVGADGMLTIAATSGEQKALQMDEDSDPQAANTWMNLRKTVNLDSVPTGLLPQKQRQSRFPI